MTTTNPSPFEIGRMMMSLWVPQAVHAAAELGVADALARGPASSVELASRVGAHAGALARLLDALVVLGLLSRDQDRFALTALGEHLRSDAPTSRRAWARLMGGADVWRAWGSLTECVRTGEAAFTRNAERTTETETFDALAADPEAAAVFHQAMADGTRSVAGAIVGAIEPGSAREVVDVGGGYGELLCAMLEAHPTVRGAVFDLEHARDGATRSFARRGLEERASFVVGDLFRAAPPSADLLLLKSVIHDWDDERALAILARCRDALRPGATLAMIEPMAPPPGVPTSPELAWIVAFSDLNMLVNTGGKERTEAEYVALVTRAGLRVVDVRSTGAFYSCLRCEKA